MRKILMLLAVLTIGFQAYGQKTDEKTKKADTKKVDWGICKPILAEHCSGTTDKENHECLEEKEKLILGSKMKNAKECIKFNESLEEKLGHKGEHDHKD